MARTQLIPQEKADELFEKALELEACADSVLVGFEAINPDVTWSQIQRWRRDWEVRTGKKLNLTAPAVIVTGDAQEELQGLGAGGAAPEAGAPTIASPRAGKRPRKASPKPKATAAPSGWEIKTYAAPGGETISFPVPSAWLEYLRAQVEALKGEI